MRLIKAYEGKPSVAAIDDVYTLYQIARATITAWIRNQDDGSVVLDLLHDHADRIRVLVEELVVLSRTEFPAHEFGNIAPAIEALSDVKPGVG